MVFSPAVRNRILTGVVPQPIPSTVTRAPAGWLVTMSELAAPTVVAGATTGSVGAGAGGDTGVDCATGVAAVVGAVLAELKFGPTYSGVFGPTYSGVFGPTYSGVFGPADAGVFGPTDAGVLGATSGDAAA